MANAVSQSNNGSVTNQAIQMNQGNVITNHYGGGSICPGPQLAITPGQSIVFYDDDILLRKELSELKECLKNKIPVLLTEPMNQNCDKSITKKLIDFRNFLKKKRSALKQIFLCV